MQRPGGGGKPLAQTDPAITQALEDLVFNPINARVMPAQAKGQPAVSVDANKKESVREFKNAAKSGLMSSAGRFPDAAAGWICANPIVRQ